MKTFVIGDIHGRHNALMQCLERSKFNIKKDKLIVLGDVVDGGFNTYAVVEELLKIPNLIFIIGNHDEFLMNHIKTGWAEEIWIQQGGANTLTSYGAKVETANFIYQESKINHAKMKIPETHKKFFETGKYWYKQNNMIFVHGGFNPKILKMTSQSKHDLTWDRKLIEFARKQKVQKYKKVFVGHTSTQRYQNDPSINDYMAPIWFNNLCMMDCGGGWNGKLAIMNVDTNKYWTSDVQSPDVAPIDEKYLKQMFEK